MARTSWRTCFGNGRPAGGAGDSVKLLCAWVIRLNQAETRSLNHRGRARGRPEFAADVRDVPVYGVRAQLKLLGDFTIPETVRNAGQDLPLAARQQS